MLLGKDQFGSIKLQTNHIKNKISTLHLWYRIPFFWKLLKVHNFQFGKHSIQMLEWIHFISVNQLVIKLQPREELSLNGKDACSESLLFTVNFSLRTSLQVSPYTVTGYSVYPFKFCRGRSKLRYHCLYGQTFSLLEPFSQCTTTILNFIIWPNLRLTSTCWLTLTLG